MGTMQRISLQKLQVIAVVRFRLQFHCNFYSHPMHTVDHCTQIGLQYKTCIIYNFCTGTYILLLRKLGWTSIRRGFSIKLKTDVENEQKVLQLIKPEVENEQDLYPTLDVESENWVEEYLNNFQR